MAYEVGSGQHWPARWSKDVLTTWLDEVTHADGVRPLNDLGVRILRGDRPGRLFWLDEPDPRALALVDREDGSVQLAVHPSARRHGRGRALATAIQAVGVRSWWSFGTLPGVAELADHLGLAPVRQLLRMGRDLSTHPPEPVVVPSGTRIERFTEDDLAELVAVNAAAFADHPEQGAMTEDDVRLAMTEPWFEADGILLARDTTTGELVGFHWTKREQGEGEVYVIGVSPTHEGKGLGRVLLNAGLAHLHRRGVDRVHLYVEAGNPRVVRMYESASFGVELRDTSWADLRPDPRTEDLR